MILTSFCRLQLYRLGVFKFLLSSGQAIYRKLSLKSHERLVVKGSLRREALLGEISCPAQIQVEN